MISQGNLDSLYESVLNEEELTTKHLNDLGFKSRDINSLLEDGTLIRIKRGFYSFNSSEQLFRYGKKLILQKKYDEAAKCFELGHKIDPKNGSICFQLFFKSVQQRDYERAFELIDTLFEETNQDYERDLCFYLLLLSYITETPEKYREFAKNIGFDDIYVGKSDKRYIDSQAQNRIRSLVLQGKISFALKQFNSLLYQNGIKGPNDLLLKTLLNQATGSEIETKKKITDLIKQKEYEEALEILLLKSSQHKLSLTDSNIIRLLEVIIKMKKTSVIPKPVEPKDDTFVEAINTNNFLMALRINKEYNNKLNISEENNAVYILLNDICDLINKLKQEKKPNINIKFEDIVSKLFNNETQAALADLKEYMRSRGQEEYEFLIIDLIQIGLLEKDPSFSSAMIALSLLEKGNMEFDSSLYIQEFYISLYNKEFKKAKLYLDIVDKSNKFRKQAIETKPLYDALAESENIYNKHKFIIEDTDPTPSKEEVASNQVDTNQDCLRAYPKVEEVKKSEASPQISSELENYVAQKHAELLQRNGILLIKPMSEERTSQVLSIVAGYNDMEAFIIRNDNKNQIVLRYRVYTKKQIDVESTIKEALTAYNEKRYQDYLDITLELIKTAPYPSAKTYSKIGLAYMKLFNIPVAIEYLTVATSLASKENLSMDFTDLIARLKGNKAPEDNKTFIKMKKSDFNDIDDFFGIENFEEINESIIASGLDVESACDMLGLSAEEKELIKLIYAREFYINGNFSTGDLFLKSVARSENKTPFIVKKYHEIERNKRFYSNRCITTERPQIRILKPKK